MRALNGRPRPKPSDAEPGTARGDCEGSPYPTRSRQPLRLAPVKRAGRTRESNVVARGTARERDPIGTSDSVPNGEIPAKARFSVGVQSLVLRRAGGSGRRGRGR